MVDAGRMPPCQWRASRRSPPAGQGAVGLVSFPSRSRLVADVRGRDREFRRMRRSSAKLAVDWVSQIGSAGVSLRLRSTFRTGNPAPLSAPAMGPGNRDLRQLHERPPQTLPTPTPPRRAQARLASGQWWREFRLALGFFTRLPLKAPGGPIAEAARAFPVAGAVVGLIGSLIYLLAMQIGLSGLLAALLAVAATVIAGGALHEDGLADFADMLVRGDRSAAGRHARQPHRLLWRAGARPLDRDQGQRPGGLGEPWLVAGALITPMPRPGEPADHHASTPGAPNGWRPMPASRVRPRPTGHRRRVLSPRSLRPGAALVRSWWAIVAAFSSPRSRAGRSGLYR